MKTTYFLGVKAYKANPTKSHVPAIWECMLGTVYARNALGETVYFDYNHEAALEFAGVKQEGVDVRLARATIASRAGEKIRPGQFVLFVRRPVQADCS
jgi:hypothetical protein